MSLKEGPQSVLGALIRKQRELAAMPMRQVAATVGISNPYLSQIERGLRAPSEAVLEAIAATLKTTSDALYADAGFEPMPAATNSTLADEIKSASELTPTQRKALIEVYRAFVDANAVRQRKALNY